MALRILIDQIQSLENKIKKIEEILSFNEPSPPQKRLLGIPGVGPKTIAAFLGEVGDDVSRFSSANKLIGFIGWHPLGYQNPERRRIFILRCPRRGPLP